MHQPMNDGPVRTSVSEEEWSRRFNLAALFGVCAHFGWDDHLFTHMTARVPGSDHQILINPMSLRYEEITASSLQKLDRHGQHVLDHPEHPHHFAFRIHRALLDAIPAAQCLVLLHSLPSIAVSCQVDGLLPIRRVGGLVGKN